MQWVEWEWQGTITVMTSRNEERGRGWRMVLTGLMVMTTVMK